MLYAELMHIVVEGAKRRPDVDDVRWVCGQCCLCFGMSSGSDSCDILSLIVYTRLLLCNNLPRQLGMHPLRQRILLAVQKPLRRSS